MITLRLDRDIDISRGDLFVDESSPLTQKQLEVTICWFDERSLNTARKYLLNMVRKTVFAKIGEIEKCVKRSYTRTRKWCYSLKDE